MFSANSRYIFNISKKTGIFTRVKMPVYRQSELLYQYSSGEIALGWIPSVGFENKMRKLIQNQKRSYWKYINTATKRVAVIMLAIVITFASAMSVKAIREPVVNTIVEIYEKFTVGLP
ncbi:MAG TPA: hypothetical protein PKX71_04540 [Candidatus Avimonas sp.]|nr:hypothetical protein [Candidatus Avimonas sp.]HQA16207.1 hypothetical protein [Candidatus Avimonas sp.]